MNSPRNKLTLWMVLLGMVGVIWAVLPLLQGSDPAPVTPTIPPAAENTWVPEPPIEGPTETASAPAAGLEPPAGPTPTTSGTSPTSTVATTVPEDSHSSEEPKVHSEEEPADQPTLAAVPPDTPAETLEALAEAVEARLVAELTGTGRANYEDVVWRTAPCCVLVTVTGLVADFSDPELVRVIVEWETDVGEGSGPTYWTTDQSGSWVPALVESSS